MIFFSELSDFSLADALPFFFLLLLLGRYWQIVFKLKCWQLNPKIYPGDFIDFWFNCVRLLNHVKVTLSKPFTRGMKSVISKLIGPLSCLSFVNVPHLLCDCFRAADSRQQGSPILSRDSKTYRKKKRVQNRFTKHWTQYYSWIDNIWTQGHIVLPAATSAVLVHVDKLTSTLTVHVEVTFPYYILHGFHGSLP